MIAWKLTKRVSHVRIHCATVSGPLSREEVARLAELAGLRLPERDLDAVAQGLASHRELAQPLRDLDLATVPSPLRADPRWRD